MGVMELAHEYPVMSGAVSVWALGVGSYLAKNIPDKIRGLVKQYFTTSITVDNEFFGDNLETFESLNSMLAKEGDAKCIRHFLLLGTYSPKEYREYYNLGVGSGTVYIRRGWRRFAVTQSSEVKDQGKRHTQIRISTIGRSTKPIKELFEEFRFKRKADRLDALTFFKDEWQIQGELVRRPLSTVMMNKGEKESIIDRVSKFLESEDWYVQRGIPYKLVIILEGPPGTGKTSLIKAIAAHFNKSVGLININGVTDISLSKSLSTTRSNMFFAIEDFDSAISTKTRDEKKDNSEESLVSLTGILNALDGLASLHGKVIFMTTNHIENIDPAITRKGRTDEIIHVGALGSDVIRDYIKSMYPEYKIQKDVAFKPEVGCNVQAAFFASDGDAEKMVNLLKEK